MPLNAPFQANEQASLRPHDFLGHSLSQMASCHARRTAQASPDLTVEGVPAFREWGGPYKTTGCELRTLIGCWPANVHCQHHSYITDGWQMRALCIQATSAGDGSTGLLNIKFISIEPKPSVWNLNKASLAFPALNHSVPAGHCTPHAYKHVRPGVSPAGSLADLPKYTPSHVTRALKAECQGYMDLAGAYSAEPASKLEETAAKHQQLFDGVSIPGLCKCPSEALAQHC